MAKRDIKIIAEQKLRAAAQRYINLHRTALSTDALTGQLQWASRVARKVGISQTDIDRIITEEFLNAANPTKA